MTEIIEMVADTTLFTKLDLKEGDHLICIQKGDKWKTAFRTRSGHYEYKVIPFGLVNVLAMFQVMMNLILHKFLDNGVEVYLDDFLRYSKNQKEPEILVKEVLEIWSHMTWEYF